MSAKANKTSARRARAAGKGSGGAGEPWLQSTTRRMGRPPLRFKGRVLIETADAATGSDSSITLWQRKSRGYVTAVQSGLIVDSVSTDSLDDAMAWLEDICRKAAVPAGPATLADLMDHAPAEIAAFRDLRALAGRVLDQLDLMSNTDAQQAASERKAHDR